MAEWIYRQLRTAWKAGEDKEAFYYTISSNLYQKDPTDYENIVLDEFRVELLGILEHL